MYDIHVESNEIIPAYISVYYASNRRTIHTVISKLMQPGTLLDKKNEIT
jgi:hypothetical protein